MPLKTLTVHEAGPEAGAAARCVGAEANPQDVAAHRGVVGGEAVPTQASDQWAAGAALPDLQNVLVTVEARL